ncbi:MAG: serine/threonine-protein kinase, partial [Planctomycetota bacterium]
MTKGSLFARILEYRGLVARAQLDQARTRQAQLAKKGSRRDLGTVLVAMGALSKKQLEEVVGGGAAKLRCTKCGSVPEDQRVALDGWPACAACNGRVDIAPGSSKLQAATPGAGDGRDPRAATIELGLSASDMATMQGDTPDLVVPVSTKPKAADPPPAPVPPIGPPRAPQPGDVLGGCRIERKLGQGGMGAVYLATHLMLDKPVALKILDPRLMNTKEVIGRFQLEARAAAKLDHENIVRVLNVGAEAGLYFMTQEFVKGESLMDVLKRNGPLPPKKAAAVIREIARGLAAAHNEGVIHRDIKPGNVMMTAEGKVKVADFGLAKEMHSDAELSHTGQVLGSPHYLSPEQGAGRPVDHRTDLYALGVTYFFLLSGKRPFDGATPIAVIFKHINEAPPKVSKFAPKTPAGHVAIVSKCLKKDPDQRYPDAETLIADIDAVISGRSPKAAEGKGGLSTVRDKPVPKPLTTRYTKEQLESRAEITDQGEAPARRSSKRPKQPSQRE